MIRIGLPALGQEILEDLVQHLQRAQSQGGFRVHALDGPEEEQTFWEHRLDHPKGLPELMREVVLRSNRLQDPRYMGHQVAVPFPDGALVGMVTDLLNNGGAIYEMGPTNSAMEEVLMARIGRRMGLPEGCGGVMCHGGHSPIWWPCWRRAGGMQVRIATLGQDGDDGLGAVLVSEQAHYCVDRAVRIMGWGAEGVGLVDTDDRHHITAEGLERALVAIEGAWKSRGGGGRQRLHHQQWGL